MISLRAWHWQTVGSTETASLNHTAAVGQGAVGSEQSDVEVVAVPAPPGGLKTAKPKLGDRLRQFELWNYFLAARTVSLSGWGRAGKASNCAFVPLQRTEMLLGVLPIGCQRECRRATGG